MMTTWTLLILGSNATAAGAIGAERLQIHWEHVEDGTLLRVASRVQPTDVEQQH